ncbi:MAG TPA: S46 family peptidase [Clostridia bacterium]|nr:S46 family peptidase [Clostridia bacterium]
MRRILALAVFITVFLSFACADEGLWLYNAAPADRIKARYGFTLTDEWLDHVRESSVRFNNGGSGSFVSQNGLVFTNHHVASDCVSKISTSEKALLTTGFYAKSQAEEARCPDLELNVLVGIEDVTGKVIGSAGAVSASEAAGAQRSRMSALEAECAKGGQRCDIVTLYSGGMYHLYKYKRYTDVRLVFAPESAIANFGGDADNFEFPRSAMDVAFFRVYENEKPLVLKHWLKWTTAGVRQGELVFMSGHPGSTSRLATGAELDYLRDVQYPLMIKWRQQSMDAARRFSTASAENARIIQTLIYSLENSQKSQKGYQAALLDKKLMAQKAADEQALRTRLVASDPTIEGAWKQLAAAMQAQREIFVPLQLGERMTGFDSRLARLARNLVRAASERLKPNGERIREYRESALPSLEQEMFSTAPVYDALETHTLTVAFEKLLQELGPDHAWVKRALGGRTPSEAASAYVSGTKLKDMDVRKALYQGGTEAIAKSEDPLIALLRDLDPAFRDVRKRYDDQVDAVVKREAGRIAQARFRLGGKELYPDATFTLRLSYGSANGYVEDGRGSIVPKGTKIPHYTEMGAAFAREQKMGGKPPYELPASWHAAKQRLNLKTPLNFVSTADSIGGSSGSPIVNTRGELVGINFDRNMQGLGRNFYYSEEGMRHIAVGARGITEALQKIYGAQALANELLGAEQKAQPASK